MQNQHFGKKNVERLVPIQGEEWLTRAFEIISSVIKNYIKNKTLLNAGCGTGFSDYMWIKQGARKIDAYDIDNEALTFAKKYHNAKGISYRKKDFNKQGFKKHYYDVVVSMEVIEHLENHEFYLKNLTTALKPDGILFITTPNKDQTKVLNKYHIYEFRYNELKKKLEDYHLKVILEKGFSTNITSQVSAMLLPSWLINLGKKLPLYKTFISLFYSPKETRADMGEMMCFICKKMK